MDGHELKVRLADHQLTYDQFAAQLNEFCRREVISPATSKNIIANWVSGRRNITPAMQFAIEQFFQNKPI